jgi:2-deoxy-D-gluconate 3-dehydrogenase
MPLAVPYGASKGGIVQMGRSLAAACAAWGKDNIQVNAILPGWIDTDLAATARTQIEGLNERVMTLTPAKRWGSPDDFAGIAIFLMSAVALQFP